MSPIKKMKFPLLMLTGFMLLTVSGCYYDVVEELYPGDASCDTTQVTYTGDILPLLQAQCLVCHSAGSNQGNVNLEGYTQVKTYAENGKLMGSVSHASGYVAMPQGAAQLSSCYVNKIRAWINRGAPNN